MTIPLTAPTLPTYLTGFGRFFSIFALSLATFLIVLDLSIANVSIPYISGDLGVAVDQGTYVITSFSVGNAIALPLTGWLTDRLGAVRLITLSIFGFVLLSALCGLSYSLPMLVTSRFFQGLLAGPLVPLSQSLLISTNPPEHKNRVLGVWSTVTVCGPVVGPILGGWITFNYSWEWIFYINIPTGIFCILIILAYLKRFETTRKILPIDKLGFFLLAIAASSFQFILDKGEQFDWLQSNLILTLSILSFLSFLFFLIWEYFKDNPLVDFSLFRYRSYTLSILFIIFMYSSYFGAIVIVPLWLQSSMGYNSVWAGLAIAPLGIPPLFLGALGVKAIERFGKILTLGLSLFFFSLSSFYTAFFATNVDVWHVMFSRLIMGFGLIFFIAPIIALSVQDVDEKRLPEAAGFFHFVRTLCAGIGTSMFTTLWIRRQAFHHERICENITPYSPAFQSLAKKLPKLAYDNTASLIATNGMVDQQSAMMTFNDIFFFMGWLFIFLLFLLPIGMKKRGASK